MPSSSEYDIHDIIRIHPYILGEEFEGLSITHEKIYDDRTRSDFVFSNEHIAIVVEVKIDYLNIGTIEQAIHYLNKEKKTNPYKKLKGVLVGSQIIDKKEFEEKMSISGYEFQVKFLDEDVPTEIKLCDNCRRANKLSAEICKFCRSNKFITDPFLFIP